MKLVTAIDERSSRGERSPGSVLSGRIVVGSPRGASALSRTPLKDPRRDSDEPASLTFSQAHGFEAFGEVPI